MNNIEGQIFIKLQAFKNHLPFVEINSSRPVHASKVLIGKTPEQALEIIPVLFNICGVAQSRAALVSIEQQLKKATSRRMELARELLVLSEIAKEHLLRIFLDWPKLFKLEMDLHELPYLSRIVSDFKLALFEQGQAFSLESQLSEETAIVDQYIDELEIFLQNRVFNCPVREWLDINYIVHLQEWAEHAESLAAQSTGIIFKRGWSAQGGGHCSQLPELDDSQLLQRFKAEDADKFILQPDWSGVYYETTSLSRQYDHPVVESLQQEFGSALITRWVARLVELAQIPQQMRSIMQMFHDSDNNPKFRSSDLGIAQVEAARGRLIHHVEIEQQKITNYQILAPTEWNFHPKGLITQSLANINVKDEDELAQLAALMINAIDPCVGYKLDIV